MSTLALHATTTLLILSDFALALVIFKISHERKIMSQELDKLTSDISAAVAKITSLESDNATLTATNAAQAAQITDLTAQLAAAQAAAGTPDSALASLDAQLEGVLAPPAPAPAPTPEPAPVAT